MDTFDIIGKANKKCYYCRVDDDLPATRHVRGCPKWVYAKDRNSSNAAIHFHEEGIDDGSNPSIKGPRRLDLSYRLGFNLARAERESARQSRSQPKS